LYRRGASDAERGQPDIGITLRSTRLLALPWVAVVRLPRRAAVQAVRHVYDSHPL